MSHEDSATEGETDLLGVVKPFTESYNPRDLANKRREG